MGDINIRIGNEIFPRVKQNFTEGNWQNSFFDHKHEHKYTFENSIGQNLTIDLVVTNINIHLT